MQILNILSGVIDGFRLLYKRIEAKKSSLYRDTISADAARVFVEKFGGDKSTVISASTDTQVEHKPHS